MLNGKFASRLLATSALTLAIGMPVAAFAADNEVETLIVTANKRAENIQDVAMSVTALSGDYLEKVGVNNAMELARFIPSVSISQSNNNRNTTVFVRGIGTSGTNPGIESSVGIFIDGVYILGAGPIQNNLQDISAIEVLRGPQGTLYGRNTPVGAMNVVSRAPSDQAEAMVTVKVGDYSDRQLSGYVGGKIAETLSGRLTLWGSTRDGYETNLATGTDVNGNNQYGGRARIKWTPTDNLTGDFIAYFARIHADCCTADTLAPSSSTGIATAGFLAAAAATGHPFRNFDDRDHVVDDDAPGRDLTRIYGLSGAFNYDLPSGHTLTSITAFNGYVDDIRALPTDMLPQATVAGSNQYLRAEGYSEELRITSPAEQRISYVGGIYLFSESIRYTTATVLGADANRTLPNGQKFKAGDSGLFYFTQKTRSAAAFGQATLHVTDALRITLGGRYSYDGKDAYLLASRSAGASTAAASLFPSNPLGAVSRDEKKGTWSAGVQYDVTSDVMAYFTAATGYKTGGFNARSAAAGVPVEFGPENSKTYEVGVKSELFDNTVVLNVDVYHMELSQFQDSILNPLTGSGFIVANAGDREVNGLEADGQWRPIQPLTLRGALAYMDAQFTDYTAGQCNNLKAANGTKPGTCNYNGLTPMQSPKWAGSLSAQWQAPLMDTGLEWFANGDITYTGERLLEPTLDPRGFEPATTVFGARIGIQSAEGNWRMSLYGKNLGDETYFLQRTLQPLNAAISGGGTAPAQGFVGWYGPPRTIGIEASVKY